LKAQNIGKNQRRAAWRELKPFDLRLRGAHVDKGVLALPVV
jgi:hypothetical protein